MEKKRAGKTFYEKYVKRPQDCILACIALVVLSPVLAVTAVLVRTKLGSPVIFQQKRPGLNEKVFVLYKFRTMTDARDEKGELLSDEIRLTDFGKRLRELSIDELPELWNIINGTLSFVGPRPQLVRDMVFMTSEQRERHNVRPGLTGLAQVKGRNTINWEDKLSYDLQYTENITFWGDWRIIFQTVGSVFRKEGIHSEGMATAEDLGDYLLHSQKVDKEKYDALQEEARKILESTEKQSI